MRRMSPREMRRLLKKFGMQLEEISDVEEVLIIRKNEILKMVEENFIDIFVSCPVDNFRNSNYFHPEYHLPDGKSVISIGIKVDNETPDLLSSVERRLNLLSFKIAHLFDI
mgnify:CR=1 FL=1